MTGRHRYPLRALRGDLLRAAMGAAGAGGLLLLIQPGWFGAVALGGLTLLFLGFLLRTSMQAGRVIELTPSEIRSRGPFDLAIFRIAIPWAGIRRIGLRYYATSRDRRGGWLALTVQGADATIRIESQIDGFDAILARVAAAAQAAGAAMSDDTAENLTALSGGTA